MTCLSVRLPWALCFFRHGKDVENRDWATAIRGTVAIHASSSVTRAEYEECVGFMRDIGVIYPFTLEQTRLFCGKVIGTVDIIDCVKDAGSMWFFGPYGFVMENPVEFTDKPSAKGQLGFWNWERSLSTTEESKP